MTRVGLRGRERPPAQVAAHPVAAARRLVRDELLHRDRRARAAALAAVVRDARVRRHPGAGEHRDAASGERGGGGLDGGGRRAIDIEDRDHAPSLRSLVFGHVSHAWEGGPMPIERIDDAGDPRLAGYRDLTDVALRRVLEPAGGLYIAESAKVIRRAVAAGHRPRSILVQEKWLDDAASVAGDAPVYVVTDAVAERLTGYAVHRGALAAMHRPALPPVAEVVAGARTVLILEDVVDPHQRGRRVPRCRGARGGRGARHAALRRSALPAERPGEHGHRLPGAVDAAAGMAGSRRRPARRRPPWPLSRSRTTPPMPLDAFVATRPDRGGALSPGAEGDGLSAFARRHRGRHRRDDPDGRRCGLGNVEPLADRAVGAAGLTPAGSGRMPRPGRAVAAGRDDLDRQVGSGLGGGLVASGVADVACSTTPSRCRPRTGGAGAAAPTA